MAICRDWLVITNDQIRPSGFLNYAVDVSLLFQIFSAAFFQSASICRLTKGIRSPFLDRSSWAAVIIRGEITWRNPLTSELCLCGCLPHGRSIGTLQTASLGEFSLVVLFSDLRNFVRFSFQTFNYDGQSVIHSEAVRTGSHRYCVRH